jgi:hypothetical protein
METSREVKEYFKNWIEFIELEQKEHFNASAGKLTGYHHKPGFRMRDQGLKCIEVQPIYQAG